MSPEAERIGETDLLAFVDGHLDPARRRAVESWLAHSPEDARRVAADQAINDGLRRLFGPVYGQDVPERLTRPLRQPAPRPLRRLAAAAAAATVLVAGGAAGGWRLAADQPVPPPVSGLVRLASGGTKPATVSDTQALEVLSESLRRAVRLPDLSSAGLRLVGRTVVGTTDRPTLQLVYHDRGGAEVVLYVQLREAAEARFHYRHGGGRGLLYWAEGPLVFALAADLPAQDMRIIAELVHNPPAPQAAGPVVPVAGGGGR